MVGDARSGQKVKKCRLIVGKCKLLLLHFLFGLLQAQVQIEIQIEIQRQIQRQIQVQIQRPIQIFNIFKVLPYCGKV